MQLGQQRSEGNPRKTAQQGTKSKEWWGSNSMCLYVPCLDLETLHRLWREDKTGIRVSRSWWQDGNTAASTVKLEKIVPNEGNAAVLSSPWCPTGWSWTFGGELFALQRSWSSDHQPKQCEYLKCIAYVFRTVINRALLSLRNTARNKCSLISCRRWELRSRPTKSLWSPSRSAQGLRWIVRHAYASRL